MSWAVSQWNLYRKLISETLNWICSENCLRGLCISWNCWSNSCWYLRIIGIVRAMIFGSLWIGIVLTIDCGDRPLIAIGWTVDVWCFQSIPIVQTNDPGDCLSTRIVLKIVFAGRLWIGIASKIDVWCFQVVGIVQTKDIGGCLLKRILLKVVFTVCLSISIPERLISGDVHEWKMLGQLLLEAVQ